MQEKVSQSGGGARDNARLRIPRASLVPDTSFVCVLAFHLSTSVQPTVRRGWNGCTNIVQISEKHSREGLVRMVDLPLIGNETG